MRTLLRDAAKRAGIVTGQLHAYDYWEYADLQLARDSEAREIVELSARLAEPARASGYARAAIQARFAIERGQWKEAAQLPGPGESKFPYTSAIRFFARALGAARAGEPDSAERDLSRLRDTEIAMAGVHDTDTPGVGLVHAAVSPVHERTCPLGQETLGFEPILAGGNNCPASTGIARKQKQIRAAMAQKQDLKIMELFENG